MNGFLLMGSMCLLATAKVFFQSKFSKSGRHTFADQLAYNGLMFLAIFLMLSPRLLVSPPNAQVLLYGMGLGALSVCYQVFYAQAFSFGKVSLTTVISSFSMVIPMLFSIVTLHEPVTALQLVGFVLIATSLVMITHKGERHGAPEGQTSVWWLPFVLIATLSAGFALIMQKAYAKLPQADILAYVALSYLSAAVFSGLVLLVISKRERCTVWKKGRVYSSALAAGVALGAYQCLNTYGSGTIDGAIFFPTVNGGTLVMTTLLGVVLFRERLAIWQVCGIGIAAVAIVLLCL